MNVLGPQQGVPTRQPPPILAAEMVMENPKVQAKVKLWECDQLVYLCQLPGHVVAIPKQLNVKFQVGDWLPVDQDLGNMGRDKSCRGEEECAFSKWLQTTTKQKEKEEEFGSPIMLETGATFRDVPMTIKRSTFSLSAIKA